MFPIYWIFVSSVKSDLFTAPPTLFPEQITLEYYGTLLSDPAFQTKYINSIVVTTTSTVLTVILSLLAGYGWARYDFTGSKITSLYIVASRSFPIVVLLVPVFQILNVFNLINTHPGLILSYFIYALPLASWLMKGFFEDIPENIFRAGRVDGLSEWRMFYEIGVPLVWPGIVATFIFSYVMLWQELLFALTFLSDEQLLTLPVTMVNMTNQYTIEWGPLMAVGVLFVLPIYALFFLTQRYFIQGLTGGTIGET
jgi:ABC-type glycerol-3-phosphate transport system permease component